MGAVTRLLTHKPNTARELDAIQRRLFAFPDIMFKHDIGITDVRETRHARGDIYFMGYLREIINEFSPEELERMYY